MPNPNGRSGSPMQQPKKDNIRARADYWHERALCAESKLEALEATLGKLVEISKAPSPREQDRIKRQNMSLFARLRSTKIA